MSVTPDDAVSFAGADSRHSESDPISAAPHIGHVHLRVSDLARSTAFYRDVLGLTVTADGTASGLPFVFLAFGGYHHHIALNAATSAGGSPPSPGNTGLHHVALVYPNERAFALTLQRLDALDYPLDACEDHGATLSVYLRDPDGIGLELYCDRPRDAWFDAAGRPVLKAEPWNPHALIARWSRTS